MTGNLTKRQIILDIFEKTGLQQKDVQRVVQMTLDAMARALSKGQDVEFRNFGMLRIQVRKPRVARNPKRPQRDVLIPKRAVIKFKPGKELKESLSRLNLERLRPKSRAKVSDSIIMDSQ